MGSEVTSINNLTRKGSLKQGLQVIEGVRELPDWITKPFQNQVLSYNPKTSSFIALACAETQEEEMGKGLPLQAIQPLNPPAPTPTPF